MQAADCLLCSFSKCLEVHSPHTATIKISPRFCAVKTAQGICLHKLKIWQYSGWPNSLFYTCKLWTCCVDLEMQTHVCCKSQKSCATSEVMSKVNDTTNWVHCLQTTEIRNLRREYTETWNWLCAFVWLGHSTLQACHKDDAYQHNFEGYNIAQT